MFKTVGLKLLRRVFSISSVRTAWYIQRA